MKLNRKVLCLMIICLIFIFTMCENEGKKPIANFSANKTEIIKQDSVYFSDLSTNEPSSWNWDFGDGMKSNQRNPIHEYSNPGTYNVELTVSNINGTDIEAKIDYIKVSPEDGSGDLITDIEGNIYRTVWIGGKNWLADNLRVTTYNDGTPIKLAAGLNEWDTATTGVYCWYDNDPAQYSKPFGALYNWKTVITNKLCPDGWHVSTDEDWNQLEDYIAFDGFEEKEALVLKANHSWVFEGNGLDEYGFTALPGGKRLKWVGTANSGRMGYWIARSEFGIHNTTIIRIEHDYDNINWEYLESYEGYSVRCVKD